MTKYTLILMTLSTALIGQLVLTVIIMSNARTPIIAQKITALRNYRMEKYAICTIKRVANQEHVDGHITTLMAMFVVHLVGYTTTTALDSLKGLIAFFTRSALAVFAEGITA